MKYYLRPIVSTQKNSPSDGGSYFDKRAEHLFTTELKPLLEKLFPNKQLNNHGYEFQLGDFTICEINMIYDAVGVSGANVCD